MSILCFNCIDMQVCNIVLLGVCFMILFSAELAAVNMQKTLISSIHDEKPGFDVEGYFVHGLSYSVYATSLWLAPSVVCLTGPRTGMILAGIGYTFYLMAFSIEEKWAIYTGASIMGASAAVLWTAEGKYLILSSTPETTSRNIGIFWFFYSSSEFYGNLIMYFQLEGKKFIDRKTRRLLVFAMSAMACVALVLFLFLRPIKKENLAKNNYKDKGPIEAFKKTWSIFNSTNIRILTITFCYTGLAQAFAFGVYSPSVGFTLAFGNNVKQLVALSGIFLGLGEMICGGAQILFSKRISQYRYGRISVMLVGSSLQAISFVGVFLNLPDNAVFGNTEDHGLIRNSVFLAMTCSFLLGLADCCLNTQVYALLAVMHPENSAQTCALYKFTKAVLKATSFYLSNHLGLYAHILILIPAALAGLFAYYKIDRKIVEELRAKNVVIHEIQVNGTENRPKPGITNNDKQVNGVEK